MSQNMIKYIMYGTGVLFAIVVIAYIIVSKKNKNSAKHIQQLKVKRW